MLNLRSIVNIKFLTISIVLFLTLVSTGFSATTYYVRTDGNNYCTGTTDAAGSSGSCAFRTILKGLQTAQAGDTVIVHNGNYTSESLASQRSGSAESLIKLQAASGDTVSIARINILHDYNVVKGFLITNPGYPITSAGVVLTGNYNQVLNNTMHATCNPLVDGEGVCIGMSIIGSYNTVSYNTLDGQNNNSNTAFGIGFYLEHASSHNTVSYNTVKDTRSPGRVFEIYGSFNRIANNEVKNCQGGSSNVDHADVFQVFGTIPAHDITIENNYIHDFGGQLGNLGVDGNYADWTNWVFKNNLFANIANQLFIYIPAAFYNNIFYNVAPGINSDILSCSYVGSHGLGITAYNNVFFNCGDSRTGWYNADRYGVTAADYNYVGTADSASKPSFNEAHGVNGGNPQFVAYNSNCTTSPCDFHTGSTSVLINKGTDLSSLFTADYAGNTRSLPWDIGAYEYGSGQTAKRPSPPWALSVQ